MMKTLHVAWREFTATVLTKAFLFGVLVLPIVMTATIPLAIFLVSQKPPIVRGSIGVIDLTDPKHPLVADQIAKNLSPEALESLIRERTGQAIGEAQKVVEKHLSKDQAAMLGNATKMATDAAAADVPQIKVEILPPGQNPEQAKEPLKTGTAFDGTRLALVIIHADAVQKDPSKPDYGTFDFFIKGKLDARVQSMIRGQVREAIINARIAQSGQNPEAIRAITRLASPEAIAVTNAGEKSTNEAQQMFVPLAFMMLLWISVFTGGQYLLTSTIEEKSNRVMEVLLSAVSPLQLMTGKILGQMSAGLLILVLYSSLGMGALVALARTDLVDAGNLVYLLLFFLIAFTTIASMMAAIGSAVTDIHEAQTLLTPIMLVVMTPMFLMMPIIWNPKSVLATTLSFTPILSPFVMVLRLASSDPPPWWQVWAALAIGVVTVFFMVRFAAKIFRIGVLMYGKPPNFPTLIRWIRMA